jgi:mismatch-specific thymine-DNA glycosylase
MVLEMATNGAQTDDHSPPPPSFNGVLQQFEHLETPTVSPQKRVTRASALNQRSQTEPARSDLKRKPFQAAELPLSVSPSKKKKRSPSGYAPPSKYSHLVNNLVDSLAPNLICVFIGVNPGILTATKGHAYCHPSNLFWKLANSSGCTARLCRPEEDRDLPRLFALGHTNIVSRPTKDASELSKAEMDEGVAMLEEKIAKWKPEAVAIVGKGIWESIWRVRHKKNIAKEQFKYGWQDEGENMGVVNKGEDRWSGARVFVTTTTSGLAAGMRPHEKEEVWRVLGEWVKKRRAEREWEASKAEQMAENT